MEVQRMIPRPVYEVLPVVYVGSGIAGLSYSDSGLMLMSALLLSGTGLVVLWLRRSYRSTRRRAAERWFGSS
jgi:hypothetical protein